MASVDEHEDAPDETEAEGEQPHDISLMDA